MSEKQNPSVKVHPITKMRLLQEKEKGHWRSIEEFLDAILNYIDEMGINLRRKTVKEPIIRIEKRIDELFYLLREIRSKEFRPVLESIKTGGVEDNRNEVMCNLARENQRLRDAIKKALDDNQRLENDILDLKDKQSKEAAKYKGMLFSLKNLVCDRCNPSNFGGSIIGSNLKVSSDYLNQLIEDIKKEYPIE